MANKFTEFVLNAIPASPVLPIVHTTDGYCFREILNNSELQPKRCDVFKHDDLIYLFYGRPAYRSGAGVKSTSLSMFYPVCFLLDPHCFEKVKRVFPFDSGAFSNNLFEDFLHRDMTLDNFLVDPNPLSPGEIPSPETPARIVSTFYESNKEYYRGVVKDSIDLTPLDFEAEAYYEWIKTKRQTSYDDRGSSIEIQLDFPISLSKDTVKAVVLPTILLDDDHVKNVILTEWEAEPLDYSTYHASPSTFTIAVLREVDQYLQTENLYV